MKLHEGASIQTQSWPVWTSAAISLAVIGLIEGLTVWVNPNWGFFLYGLLFVAI